jgi:hypothetical protein
MLGFLIACSSSPAALDGNTDAYLPDVGGGAISELRFAVVGDTRPASPNDTTNYPTPIITKIWQDVEAESPHPQFAISTGDYMFADTTGTQQMPQLDKYMAARAAFTGVQYPAMGNHECTGATDSNCGMGAKDGITKNMTDFIQTMLVPIGVAQPYYVEHFTATHGTRGDDDLHVRGASRGRVVAVADAVLGEPDHHRRAPAHDVDRRPHARVRALRERQGDHRR